MKRKLHLISLLIACIGMSSVSFAQTWDAPSPKGSVPVSGTAYYVYNIGKHGFLNRGGNWGTQAVATPSPYQWTDNTTLVKWTAVNTSGSTWTFQYNLGGNNVGNHYLFAADPGNGNVYTDNSLNTHYWVLDLVDASKNIYTLQVPSSYGGYNAEQFLGVESAAEETNRGYTNLVRYDKPSGDDYTKWVFLSQEDYDLYLAKVTLDRYMTYAQMIGEIDLTSYITTYNADVIADINTAANNLYTALNPTDVTSYITNPSFESAFSGWINNGFASQNSGGLDPYKDGNVFAEKWITSSSNLAASSITQQLTGIPNGTYGLVLSAHAYKQAEGYNPYHTNAFVTAASATENYATEVNIRKNYFIDFIEVTDGTLTIGYKTEGDITCNWTAFDNFRLYLYTNATVVNISKTSLFFDEASTEQTFTVSGTGLSNNVVLSGPTGISFNPASVTAAEAQAEGGKTVTVTWDPSLLGTKLDGQITVSSIGADSRTINFVTSKDSECVDLLAPAKNLITDPYFNNPVQQGWGAGQGISSENAYCGAYSGKISGTRGGSIDRTVSIASGTACILRAYVKTNNTGFLFGFQPNAYEMAIPNTNEVWELFEANFTATADLTLLYFNNYAANTEGTGYIDNYELYEAWIVDFNTDDGSAVDPVYAVKGEKIAAPAAPTKPDHTFKGWYKEVGLNNAWDFGTDVVDGNKTLYAKWEEDIGTGIDLTKDAVVKTEFFNLTGMQLEKIDQSGLYIIKKTYESGKTDTLKKHINLVK